MVIVKQKNKTLKYVNLSALTDKSRAMWPKSDQRPGERETIKRAWCHFWRGRCHYRGSQWKSLDQVELTQTSSGLRPLLPYKQPLEWHRDLKPATTFFCRWLFVNPPESASALRSDWGQIHGDNEILRLIFQMMDYFYNLKSEPWIWSADLWLLAVLRWRPCLIQLLNKLPPHILSYKKVRMSFDCVCNTSICITAVSKMCFINQSEWILNPFYHLTWMVKTSCLCLVFRILKSWSKLS